MLAKRKFLISALLSTVILTNSITAQGLECSGGACHINVKNFAPSKNMPKEIKRFKHTKKQRIFRTNHADEELKVNYQDKQLDTFSLESEKYVKQDNEIVELLTEEEKNTIIPAPEKFIATEEERQIFYQQQLRLGVELEEIELTSPMPLYYCKNNTEPIYDDKLSQFQCLITSNHS